MNYDVHIYTDGAARNLEGGYGVVMESVKKTYSKEFYEGFRLTTNNRMELLADCRSRKIKEPK
jgi:ribonuclease HI